MSDEQAQETIPTITFDANGLIPVIAQDETSGEVLLLAYMNAEALERTLAEGVLVFWSRSRRALWRKGEQSGNTLRLCELRVNCEGNSLLARVRLEGAAACHEGYRSCYYRRLAPGADGSLAARVIAPRLFDPAVVYGAGEARKATADTSFATDARALYAAYECLRDSNFSAQSQTSRLLHELDRAATTQLALARAHEELAELRGVLDGGHRHLGDERDVILEASQVGYWATLAAVADFALYDDWQPHLVWLAGWDGVEPTLPMQEEIVLLECAALLAEAGSLCRRAGVHPARVVAADLAAMRAKYGGTAG